MGKKVCMCVQGFYDYKTRHKQVLSRNGFMKVYSNLIKIDNIAVVYLYHVNNKKLHL